MNNQRLFKSPSSGEMVAKIYLFSENENKREMDIADKTNHGLVKPHMINDEGDKKVFTRSLTLNKYQYDLFSKDDFKSICQGDENLVKIQEDLSKNIESSQMMQTSKVKEMLVENEDSLSM
jgi:hypothetical protein